MPLHLLNLPIELLERILVLLFHENARSIQACRQACRSLNVIIAQSKLVQYLERLALLGMYDPLFSGEGGAASATLSLADRAAALRTWEDAWNALVGGRDGDAGVFWQEREPDLHIALPPPLSSTWSSSLRIKYILATIIDPDPLVGTVEEHDGQHGIHDEKDHISLGSWFITATRSGIGVRASYSYLDLHGCLSGAGAGEGGGEEAPGRIQSDEEEKGDRGADYDRIYWTCIKVPVWNVVAFALSTELDLAVVISVEGKRLIRGGESRKGFHFALRPLRFQDGTPHPCAKVPTIRFRVTGALSLYMTQAQVLGDYLLLWIGPSRVTRENYTLGKLYLIAWKQGSITLLLEDSVGKYGTVHMISNEVLALVQLNPPGIELCRVSNMKIEGEGEGEGEREGGGGDYGSAKGGSSRNDGPRIDKLCTLLFPSLRQRRDGTGTDARTIRAFCDGGHLGHQMFSRGPWLEYRSAPLGRHQMFRPSTKDSIVNVVMDIHGCERWPSTFEVAVRCATLLAYADGTREVPTATIDGDGVPWDAWGQQVTAMSNDELVTWGHFVGERRAAIKRDVEQIYIRDYNSYRIRQARASMVAKGLGGSSLGDSRGEEDDDDDDDDEEWNADPKVTRRIIETSTIQGGEWLQEDVTTALPHLDVKVDVPGCRDIYMDLDQVLLHVDDLDEPLSDNREGERRARTKY